MYNIAGNRHSMVELPSSQPPPPYQPSSQDDMTLMQRPGSAPPQPFARPAYPVMPAPYLDSAAVHPRRSLRHARYESIRERTEPESSSSDVEFDEPPRKPCPPPRGLKPRPRPLSADVNIDPKDLKALALLPPPSSQDMGGRDGGTPSADSGEGGMMRVGELHRPELMTNGSLHASLRRYSGGGVGGGGLMNGDIKMRKRSKRDRLRMYGKGE
jgi:hypothetical protein